MNYVKTIITVTQDQFSGKFGVDIELHEYSLDMNWYGDIKVEDTLIACRAVEVAKDKRFETDSESEAETMRQAVEDAFHDAVELVIEDPEYATMVYDYNSIAQYHMNVMAF